MPALKVFISSTCYDLDSVRDGLRSFVHGLGYEPVMSEYGDVLYDPLCHTHLSCVDAVKDCDMLVLLIGGRFGGKAVDAAVSAIDFESLMEKIKAGTKIDSEKLSITHLEVLKAIEIGIPVYTFVKEDVYGDHNVYEKNKNKPIIREITFPSIEKAETAQYIFEFINIVRLRNKGNNIFPFKKETDIEGMLKAQWASLFQKLIAERSAGNGQANANTLEQKVRDLEKLVQTLVRDETNAASIQAPAAKEYSRILWVDDYPENSQSVMSFFDETKVQFDTALTTAQGLKLYKTNVYDLIITDINRKGETNAGVKLMQELRRLHCQTPIVVYSTRESIQKQAEEFEKLAPYKITNKASDVIASIQTFIGH